MKYASLFAGIGGFDLALNRLGHTAVYVNEWDKYSCDTYEKNFGHRPDSRDITTVPEHDLPDFDLLVGGFPCQAFSIAGTGKRRGFDEARGTLFFDIARILKAKRPAYLLLENVKGLLSHDDGRTFEIILRTLDELGYDIQWQVCNSKDFGVPQNRERVLIVGHLRGKPRSKVFPLAPTNSAITFSNTIRTGGKGSLTAKHAWDLIQVNNPIHSNDRVYDPEGISPTLNTMQGGNRQPFVIDHGTIRRTKISNTIDANYWKGLDNHGARTGIQNGVTIRRLTPTECERLQGFPDNWTKGVSDTQRYKQLGNAVTVNVIYEVAKRAFINR